jgi:hypothetical protein
VRAVLGLSGKWRVSSFRGRHAYEVAQFFVGRSLPSSYTVVRLVRFLFGPPTPNGIWQDAIIAVL